MYYPDFSEYEYCLKKKINSVLNVGWIENGKPFKVGVVDDILSGKLEKIFWGTISFSSEVNLIRGQPHRCNLCGSAHVPISVDGKTRLLGCSEIWIPRKAEEGYYASPSLILHYISEHAYLPPQDYIDAVMALDLSRSFQADEVRFELLLKRS